MQSVTTSVATVAASLPYHADGVRKVILRFSIVQLWLVVVTLSVTVCANELIARSRSVGVSPWWFSTIVLPSAAVSRTECWSGRWRWLV